MRSSNTWREIRCLSAAAYTTSPAIRLTTTTLTLMRMTLRIGAPPGERIVCLLERKGAGTLSRRACRIAGGERAARGHGPVEDAAPEDPAPPLAHIVDIRLHDLLHV